VLYRESQRISLRAFLRTLLHNPQIANTKAMEEFLTTDPVTLSDDDAEDITRRKHLDEKRVEEQKQFYEVARKRAAELDVYMEQYVHCTSGADALDADPPFQVPTRHCRAQWPDDAVQGDPGEGDDPGLEPAVPKVR
jgi:hypothetical protein